MTENIVVLSLVAVAAVYTVVQLSRFAKGERIRTAAPKSCGRAAHIMC